MIRSENPAIVQGLAGRLIYALVMLAVLSLATHMYGQDCGCDICDFDDDGDVDQADFGYFQSCLTGEGVVQSNPFCWDARLDIDYDVDPDDLELFLQCMSGANIPFVGSEIPDAVLTEFMAANDDEVNGVQDEDGDNSDWIEVYVPCRSSLDLQGWYLTDDSSDLTKWQFPSVLLGRGEYLIVFASGKDRAVSGAELHTNFKLASEGEYVALVRPDGVTIANEYGPVYPPQFSDVSYGIAMDSGGMVLEDTERYFVVPSPGGANGLGAADLGPIVFSVDHLPVQPGDAEDLCVTAMVGEAGYPVSSVTLHYRVMFGGESTVPMLDDGAHGDGSAVDGVYGAVIPADVSAPGEMVRYYITAEDTRSHVSRWPLFESATESAQYFGTVVADPSVATDLPVLYWFVADPAAAETETGTQASLFFDGQFYDNIEVHARGGAAMFWPKKNFKFDFYKGAYFRWGDDVPLVEEFNLQSSYSDKSYIRQVLAYETYANAGAPGCVAFPVRVQQNNAFYSVATFLEEPDRRLLERLGLDQDGALYKMYNQLYDAYEGVEKITRENEDHSDLQDLVDGHSHENPNRLEYLLDNVNVPASINYLAATTIMHDNDHVAKNYYLYRDTEGNGEWMFLPWDKDLTFGRNYVHDLAVSDRVLNDVIWADADSYGAGAPSHPLFGSFPYKKCDGAWNGLITALFDVPETREMYLCRLRTLMDEILQAPGTAPAELLFEQRIDELVTLMASDVLLDRAAWGNPYGADQDFAAGVGILKNDYLSARRTHLFNTHSTPGGGIIPGSQPPSPPISFGAIEYNPTSGEQDEEYIELLNPNAYAVDVSGWTLQGGAQITFQPGTVIRANNAMYVSPDVVTFRSRSASPTGGEARFIQGDYEGHLSARGETLELRDKAGNLIASTSYAGTPSDPQLYLRITEIMYHPADATGGSYDDNDFEFVELRNIGNGTLDLSGVHFTQGIEFDFTGSNVTTLGAGDYVLVVRHMAAFESRYGVGLPIAGEYTGLLENSGENIRLEDASNEKVLQFDYDDAWYPNTDGAGHSLTINDEYAPWDTWELEASWRESTFVDGSPGQGD